MFVVVLLMLSFGRWSFLRRSAGFIRGITAMMMVIHSSSNRALVPSVACASMGSAVHCRAIDFMSLSDPQIFPADDLYVPDTFAVKCMSCNNIHITPHQWLHQMQVLVAQQIDLLFPVRCESISHPKAHFHPFSNPTDIIFLPEPFMSPSQLVASQKQPTIHSPSTRNSQRWYNALSHLWTLMRQEEKRKVCCEQTTARLRIVCFVWL